MQGFLKESKDSWRNPRIPSGMPAGMLAALAWLGWACLAGLAALAWLGWPRWRGRLARLARRTLARVSGLSLGLSRPCSGERLPH